MAETVSSFELIFKPQSPVDPSTGGQVAKVIQGYFLSVTNLEDEDYFYRFNFRIADPSGALPAERTLTDNTVAIVDTPSGDNAFTRLVSGDGENFRLASGSVKIPARGTALVAVLPQVFGPIPGDPNPITTPAFEVRGYVEISLPLIFNRPSKFGVSVFEQQSKTPVSVLLTPQYRASYLDEANTITDQTQSTVPTGNGSGVVEVAPDKRVFLPGPKLPVDNLLDLFDPRELTLATASVIATLAEEGRLDEFNALLSKAGVPASVGRARGKATAKKATRKKR